MDILTTDAPIKPSETASLGQGGLADLPAPPTRVSQRVGGRFEDTDKSIRRGGPGDRSLGAARAAPPG